MSYYDLLKKAQETKKEKEDFPESKDFFIAIYTNKCKEYCDERFFNNLFESNIGEASVNVCDNSTDLTYKDRLEDICRLKANIYHIAVDEPRMDIRFLRNVTESVLLLREKFLQGDWKYFVIMESDVLPQDPDFLKYFLEVTDQADIIGGLYYMGFHSPESWEGPARLVKTHHVLSGCTLYKREFIEKVPFRWSEENLAAFPDAWASFDSCRNGNNFRLANYTKILCNHLENSPGDRGHGRIS